MLLLTVSASLMSTNIEQAKDSIVVRMYQYKFPNSTKNVLVDGAHTLFPFFEQLKALENDSFRVVSICHIGDSHIQADAETGITRRMFQDFFGDAGRGLVAPLKLAKTNEPRNYRISSSQKWETIKCIKQENLPVGVGGLVLTSTNPVASVKIETLDLYNPEKWNFNDITVFYDTNQVSLTVSDSIPPLYSIKEETAFSKRFQLDTLVNTIDFTWEKEGENPIQFYGASIRNGRSGVLYHAIGINGAHYDDYSASPLFMRQIKELTPSLIIISMGINEAYDKGFNSNVFYNSIDVTIKQIREQCPDAIFLLTTPAETWYRFKSSKYRRPHPNIVQARDVLVKYAKDKQLAYWDLFSITGGKGSARTWRKHKLLRPDGVHFTQDGYEFMGELFFEAIYNTFKANTEYNEHVQ
ncbi:MAG: GDSL-type esterase/lipase family protein [Dysgonamonadaceae bacterium]|nr:GDSL-type esterase/lipase family protein [Dysgonamonadaceae bacterium]